MKPIHVFILFLVIILIGVGIWFWWNLKGPGGEVEISLDPPVHVDDLPKPVEPPILPRPRVKPDVKDAFEEADCQWLVRHVPDEDVSYKPGVDVKGNKVVPADLNGSYSFELPKTVTATVSRRLLKHPNLRQETPFAEVEIDLTTGAVKINGEGLTNEETKDLVAFCSRDAE